MGIQSGNTYLGRDWYGADDTDWKLMGSEGYRLFQKTITFPIAFGETPAVLVSLVGYHILEGSDPRILVGATNVTSSQFDLQITTYGNTGIKGAGVMWMAYDSDVAHS